MVQYWGDGGTDSKQVLSSAFRHLPLFAWAHALAQPPMPEGALFTNLGRPPSLDIVYMTGKEISSPELSRDREQCPKSDRQDVQADWNLLIL